VLLVLLIEGLKVWGRVVDEEMMFLVRKLWSYIAATSSYSSHSMPEDVSSVGVLRV
jgi:hypothetical protein